MKRLVFLHIPKTAGQTVHFELERIFRKENVSPVRVHTQSPETSFPDPERYLLFSGHIDWHDIERVPEPRVTFSVLRDPGERVASFYFYLRSKARQLKPMELTLPTNRGLALASELSADDYFCNPNLPERVFIDDHYDNFYTHYFASRRIRGRSATSEMSPMQLIGKAIENIKTLDLICMTDRLDLVERLISDQFGHHIRLVDRFANRGPLEFSQSRYAALMEEIKEKRSVERIKELCHLDQILLKELGFGSGRNHGGAARPAS